MNEENALALQKPGQTSLRLREATDVASVCRQIAEKAAIQIGEKKYLPVEVWTTIAVAHGCIASIKEGSVQEVLRDGKLIGVRAVAEIRRQADGQILSSAEGFVGDDEVEWFGSHGEKVTRYSRAMRREIEIVVPKRQDYAIRSMAQTRGISRVCRTSFSHVVVMMELGFATTPFEEMMEAGGDAIEAAAQKAEVVAGNPGGKEPERKAEPVGGTSGKATKPLEEKAGAGNFADRSEGAPAGVSSPSVPRDGILALEKQFEDGKWKDVKIHFGSNNGKKLGELELGSLAWYCWSWAGKGKNSATPTADDNILRAACNRAIVELNLSEPRR